MSELTPVEKFIAEVRAAIADKPDGSLRGPQEMFEVLACITDALEAYDATMTETADDQPEKPQE